MASHERRPALEFDEPDTGFQAGFGFYVGLVAAGVAASAGLLAGASTATLLGILPSTVTAVAIAGHILTRRARGLPERIGRSRWRRLACYAPPIAFAATLAAPLVTSIEATGRFVALMLVVTLVTGVTAYGVDRMARNRYIDALTADEPTAVWTWRRTGLTAGGIVFGACLVITIGGGLYSTIAWGLSVGPFMVFYGLIFLLQWYGIGGDWHNFDQNEQATPPTIRAHEAGLVVERSVSSTFVPWDDVADVRLTDDELVFERRWLDLRCDRAAIDDPEATFEGIQRARGRADATRQPNLAD
ncbi:PH domain-containing protein [Haloterrigena sp. SYSU A558-1]|uniref:PH domain-containing protein n=1 Tax=Haloterrigena gelatinilytica TaxID=2741724 RepID=A0ABX2LHH5_9EURY|nr:PH domain-containing protein [Haloterrigena gelatinilytica]NUC73296.1 PH domain-containing protein [Haloterrigena gelatinilytica]